MGHDLRQDGRSFLPPHAGWPCPLAVELCCSKPDVGGAPAPLLDHSLHGLGLTEGLSTPALPHCYQGLGSHHSLLTCFQTCV